MDTDTLKKMTVAQLREEARKIPGVTGLSGMKKDELVALLEGRSGGGAAEAAGGAATKKNAKSATAGSPASLGRPQLKARIRELKIEKQQAVAGGDVLIARRCNREIHRCKHLLRKLARQGG